jgi:farnesyl diphosphate synthase
LELKSFAKFLGLAFQIVDDILDATGEEKTLGKKVGRDLDLQKPNFVQLMGINKAREYADKLLESALQSIEKMDSNADPLRMLAENLTHRVN